MDFGAYGYGIVGNGWKDGGVRDAYRFRGNKSYAADNAVPIALGVVADTVGVYSGVDFGNRVVHLDGERMLAGR